MDTDVKSLLPAFVVSAAVEPKLGAGHKEARCVVAAPGDLVVSKRVVANDNVCDLYRAPLSCVSVTAFVSETAGASLTLAMSSLKVRSTLRLPLSMARIVIDCAEADSKSRTAPAATRNSLPTITKLVLPPTISKLWAPLRSGSICVERADQCSFSGILTDGRTCKADVGRCFIDVTDGNRDGFRSREPRRPSRATGCRPRQRGCSRSSRRM